MIKKESAGDATVMNIPVSRRHGPPGSTPFKVLVRNEFAFHRKGQRDHP